MVPALILLAIVVAVTEGALRYSELEEGLSALVGEALRYLLQVHRSAFNRLRDHGIHVGAHIGRGVERELRDEGIVVMHGLRCHADDFIEGSFQFFPQLFIRLLTIFWPQTLYQCL